MKTKPLLSAFLLLALILTSTLSAQAEQTLDANEEQAIKNFLLEQANAVDQISIEVGKQGVVLTNESLAVLNSYSDLLRSEAQKPKVGAKIKNVLKKIGKGFARVGIETLKTTGYIGEIGLNVIMLPVFTTASFTGGLVSGSDPSNALEIAGTVTGVVASGVVSLPIFFSMPALMLVTPALGLLGMGSTALLCESALLYSESFQLERYCGNMEKVNDALGYIPQEASYNAGAKIHDTVAKLLKKIVRKKRR